MDSCHPRRDVTRALPANGAREEFGYVKDSPKRTMMKLFITGTTRALPPCMLLEEAGISYEFTVVDIRKKERPADLMAVNPLGRLPALKDGAVTIDQSVAILVYLADKLRIFLPAQEPARSETIRCLMISSMDIMASHSAIFRLSRRDDGNYAGLLRDYRQRLLGDIAYCNDLLEKREYLAGELSIADLALYTILGQYDSAALQRNKFDRVLSWLEAMRVRAAVRSAESKCPYIYDVGDTLGHELLDPEAAAEGFRPVAATARQ